MIFSNVLPEECRIESQITPEGTIRGVVVSSNTDEEQKRSGIFVGIEEGLSISDIFGQGANPILTIGFSKDGRPYIKKGDQGLFLFLKSNYYSGELLAPKDQVVNVVDSSVGKRGGWVYLLEVKPRDAFYASARDSYWQHTSRLYYVTKDGGKICRFWAGNLRETRRMFEEEIGEEFPFKVKEHYHLRGCGADYALPVPYWDVAYEEWKEVKK